MPYLGVLGLEFYKTIIIFEIRTLKFVKLQNLGPKMPYWTFLTKSALFGYFRQELKKNYCQISNQHPQICIFAKLLRKRCLNLGPKISYLGIFGLEFSKTIVIFEIRTLKFDKNESLTHTVNFGIGSVFSKGSGSAFSEGPGRGQGTLYKSAIF